MRPIKFRLTIQHLWGLTVLMGIFVFINTHPIRPQDFWWHITIGREILTTGKIPTVDIYSYTEAGQPYPSYQMFWLMETALYGIFRVGGPALVVFIHSLLISSAYGVIFWLCKRITNNWRIAAFSVLFAAALGLNDWNVRPQGITFLLASMFLLAIYEYRKNPRWHWLVIFPLGMLIWVNSHGTFVIGLALIGIWWGQEIWNSIKQRVITQRIAKNNQIVTPGVVLSISGLVCLINPRGTGIIIYLRTLTSNNIVQNLVTEWAPPTFHTLMGVIFFCGLIGCVVLLAISPKRPSFFQLVTLLTFGLLSIKTSRGIVWFGLVMAPIIAEHLSAIIKRYQKTESEPFAQEGSRILNFLFTSVIIFMGIITLPWFKSILPLPIAKAGLISAETPVQATQILLDKEPNGQLFNAMSFGSYLIWAAYPKYQVFVDSRIELFSEKDWLDYLNISNANGDWESLLQSYGVNILMLSPMEQPGLIEAALKSSQWDLLYKDEAATLFERK